MEDMLPSGEYHPVFDHCDVEYYLGMWVNVLTSGLGADRLRKFGTALWGSEL